MYVVGTLGCVKGIYCCAESVKNHVSPQNPIILMPKVSPSDFLKFNAREWTKSFEVYALFGVLGPHSSINIFFEIWRQTSVSFFLLRL